MLHDDEQVHDVWLEPAPDAEHDQVGTVEVQILLSWFFETSTPTDLSIDLPHAA